MSIVTLKRKSQVKYNNMSVNKPNFSLNGTLRNQGYVGQTSLSRTLLKTPMKGNVPCGHGGCCGKFDKSQLILAVNPISVTMNNSKTIKPSVINTHGMIENKYHIGVINSSNICKCAKTNGVNVVKPDNNQNINIQSDYINNLTKTAASCNPVVSNTIIPASCSKCSSLIGKSTNSNLFTSSKKSNNQVLYTKPTSDYLPISQGEYLLQMQQECIDNDVSYIKKNTQGTPFAGFKAN